MSEQDELDKQAAAEERLEAFFALPSTNCSHHEHNGDPDCYDCVKAECRRLAGVVEQLQQRVEALTPPDLDEDACSFAVIAARMSRIGYSYDAKEGIWWKADSRPGVLDEAIKRAEAAEGALAHLRERVRNELNGLAVWIRTPGNIYRDDAIDECARAIENYTAALASPGERRSSVQPEHGSGDPDQLEQPEAQDQDHHHSEDGLDRGAHRDVGLDQVEHQAEDH
jgi:hypothetical protein